MNLHYHTEWIEPIQIDPVKRESNLIVLLTMGLHYLERVELSTHTNTELRQLISNIKAAIK